MRDPIFALPYGINFSYELGLGTPILMQGEDFILMMYNWYLYAVHEEILAVNMKVFSY